MILIFESHPVQYRVPLYRRVADILGQECLKVVYGSDFSLRAYRDQEFGEHIEWKSDLTSGYQCQFLKTLRNPQLDSFRALGGKGIEQCFIGNRVSVVLLTSLRFEFDFVALYHARKRKIPILLRTETQDQAFPRSKLKSFLRSTLYRLAYRQIDQVLPIGKLNADHYRQHGKNFDDQHFVRYAVPDMYVGMSDSEKESRRQSFRKRFGIPQDSWVVGFSGKFIDKKNPHLVIKAVSAVNQAKPNAPAIGALMVGTGPLRANLETYAASAGIPVWFPGFLDQQSIADAYLAMDCLMLPSRQMGETWGLVVNEALQAGCSVVMSDAVGSSVEFGDSERVRVIPVNDTEAAAKSLILLQSFQINWTWAETLLRPYSIEVNAYRMANLLGGEGIHDDTVSSGEYR